MDLRTLLTNNGTECSIDDDWFTWNKAMLSAMNEFIPIYKTRRPPSRTSLDNINHTTSNS
jgi:hypothetical protein